jgi:hypothetical protein
MVPTITNTALDLLSAAATQLQYELVEKSGMQYSIDDLRTVLVLWLQGSIESLCEEAVELCLTGDRTHASFNRDDFERYLKALQPTACILATA